jgi:guanylate kinase
MNPRGTLVVISAPSGGGKNAIIRELLKLFPGSTRFVTTTTRLPREGERSGIDYHFVSEQNFKQMIEDGAFIEYNFYAGNYYGSEKIKLEETLNTSSLVFAPLDINGKKQLDSVNFFHISIFLLPEDLNILKNRIVHRGGLTAEEISARMNLADDEIAEAKKYDLSVINPDGNMHEAVAQIQQFLEGRLLA